MRPVMQKLGALVKEGRVVFISLYNKVFSLARCGWFAKVKRCATNQVSGALLSGFQ